MYFDCMDKKPEGLTSGIAIQFLDEATPRLPLTAAARLEMLHYLMNFPVTDEQGNQIYKKNGKPKTVSLLTKKEARKLLGFK